MKRFKFLAVYLLLGVVTCYAKEVAIVTDKNTIDGNVKVNVLSHPKYDYESINLYQESVTGESVLLGNYLKGVLNNTTIALNTAYKQSVLKGVINNPKIVNEGSEVYIKTNLAYYTIEGSSIEWGSLFNGLGQPTKEVWTITSYDEANVIQDKKEYTYDELPSNLDVGTHIVDLEYYDLYGNKFENTKTIKVMRKTEYSAKILIDDTLKDSVMMRWAYSFNGIAKKVNWYINDELQTELPQRLSEGNYTIKLEIINELAEVYTDTKEVEVKHVLDLDSLIQGGIPEGTKISTTAPTYAGNVNNLINRTMYEGDWSTTGYYADLVLEFPYAINIDMFEIGKQSVPPCDQSMVLTGYRKDGTKIKSSDTLKFYSYDIRNFSEEEMIQDPQKIYASWDNLGIEDCTKLVISYNSGSAWGCLRYLGFGYTKTLGN